MLFPAIGFLADIVDLCCLHVAAAGRTTIQIISVFEFRLGPDRAMAAARHLMQRPERQSPSREVPVDRLDPEGQHQSPAAGCAFEAPDALAKLLDTGRVIGVLMSLATGSEDRMFFQKRSGLP